MSQFSEGFSESLDQLIELVGGPGDGAVLPSFRLSGSLIKNLFIKIIDKNDMRGKFKLVNNNVFFAKYVQTDREVEGRVLYCFNTFVCVEDFVSKECS